MCAATSPAVALFTLSQQFMLAMVGTFTAAGVDGSWFLTLLGPAGVGLVCIGWTTSCEPAFDVCDTHRSNGPAAV